VENNCFERSRRAKTNWILLGAVAVVWMMVIFGMSAMQAPASKNLSANMTKTAVEAFVPGYREVPADIQSEIISVADHLVRKTAHFAEYMLLGLFVTLPFLCYKGSFKSGISAALLICMAYAVSDEVHQIFVLGRGPMAGDVFLDWAGSAFGVMVTLKIAAQKQKY
jgi:VanZ family protein